MARFPLLAAALALLLSACGPRLTQDRLTPQDMRALVSGPLGRAEAGDLEGARREFEALLERSARKTRSDLLTAFGVSLYTLDFDHPAATLRMRAAIGYLERAIPATEARFGPRHPEVALALNTYADALRQSSAGDPPIAVDRALARAYRIRIRALGPRNPETVMGLLGLAEVTGLPSRTGGDPARVDRSGAMFEEVIRALEAKPGPGNVQPAQIRRAQFQMFVRNGRTARALEVARAADAGAVEREPGCEIGPNRRSLAELLGKEGQGAAAREAIRPDWPQPEDCA